MPTEARPHELIGRGHPAALLRAEVTRVIDSHGGLVLVTGEAGIGKTTLVTSAAAEARRRGALVVGGACWDSGSAPGYWPWVQVIRALRRAAAPHEWAEAEQSAGGSLAALLGEAGAPAQPHIEVTATAETDPASAFQIYDAVTTALVALAQHHPLVIVIDDLHAADPASLRLLEFAARQTWFERLLLIGTYRDAEVEPVDHPLRDLLSPLVAKATSITLTGLDQAGVGALMARTAGHDPPADLVAEVHVRTGGNPFFVEQTARLWRSGGSATAVAPGVRDALLRRLSLLPRPVSELLPAAAVLGREFHRQVLAATVAAPVAHVDRLLDLAVIARLVVTKGGGRFAFVHDLVRETLYDAVADVRDLHAAVVRALDGSPGLARRMLPSDLAGHAYLAGDRVAPERAIDLLQAAARAARSRLAGEEELGHLRRAHEVSAAAGPRRRVLVCLDLGRELHHRGERDEARGLFEEAGALAAGDPELTARVALVFRSHYGHDSSLDRLRRAHAELVGEPAPDDRLALDLVFHLAAQARQGGDDDALAFSLWAHHDIIWGPGTAGERVALTGELLAVARRTSDQELEHYAGALRWVAMIEEGDPRYLAQFHDYAAKGRSTDDAHLNVTTAVDASIVAALAGRFAEAESLMTGLSLDGRNQDFDVMLDHHRWALLWLQGRVEEQEDVLRRLRSSRHPDRGLLEALTALQAGDVGTALRHHLAGAAVGRMTEPLWLRFEAELAAATRDRELAAGARAALLPYRGRWAVSYYGWDISGPYDLWIAMLDLAEERWEEAAEGFTRAYRSADRMRARPWSVLARARLAEALLGGGDVGRAGPLLEEVRREATELGMNHVLDALPPQRSAAAEATPPEAPERDEGPGPEPATGDFRKDGEVWTLRFAGRLAHMPDAKGLRDLHNLLGHPGADIPAVHLLAPEGGDLVLAARGLGGDAVLDEEAKADYRRRLSVLDDEIDRAAERGDDDRAAEHDRERAALLEELRTAAGLGGRSRRLGDEAERARKTVTARIRDTLRKLTHTHPELATHLRATISTGATCRYQPLHTITWHL
ncbi:AAA family ATPase [Nonomuraea sp. NPDC052265]|uniref:AAA family ATPase n=1 Tax=Nonomuraea sp. NPDC052265 TaxID=3364374 RepID=UPI0037CA5985